MAYRDDVEALTARHAALAAEADAKARERDDAGTRLAEARARVAERTRLDDVRAGGPARRRGRLIVVSIVIAGVVLTGAFLFAGHRPSHDETVRAFVDEVCACRDMDCVSDVVTRYGANWREEARETTAEDLRLMDYKNACIAKIAGLPPPVGE